MDDLNIEQEKFLSFKIIQSGEIIKISLNQTNLRKKFQEIYLSLLRELKLKHKDAFLSNDEGKMIGIPDLGLSLEGIINKFGRKLRLYCEKVF